MPYEFSPLITEPSPDSLTLWRYMDFTKFVSLLDSTALHFARSDQFEDPWEGAFPEPDVAAIREAIAPHLDREDCASQIVDDIRAAGRSIYLNCWHANEYESAAMWKLYSTSDESVAIRSTLGRLKACFGSNPHPLYIGQVHYLDYSIEGTPVTDWTWNALSPLFCKRRSFSHEREIRAARFRVPETPDDDRVGLIEPVDLSVLIEAVFVSPTSQQWYAELCGAVLAKFGLEELPLEKSDLFDAPFK